MHGDSPGAVAVARAVRSALTDAGVALGPFAGGLDRLSACGQAQAVPDQDPRFPPAAVARAFNPEAVEYLLDQAYSLPSPLNFEAGLVFGTMPGQINPEHVLNAVDVILGLLDRMGIAPIQPATKA